MGLQETSAVALHHTRTSMENGYMESFQRKFRDECAERELVR